MADFGEIQTRLRDSPKDRRCPRLLSVIGCPGPDVPLPALPGRFLLIPVKSNGRRWVAFYQIRIICFFGERRDV